MKLLKKHLDALKALAVNNESVARAVEFIEFVSHSPYMESYISRVKTLNQWNKELSEATPPLIGAKKEDKDIDLVFKLLEKQPDWLEGTERIRMRLTGEQLEKVTKQAEEESKDLAFG